MVGSGSTVGSPSLTKMYPTLLGACPVPPIASFLAI